MYTGLLCRMAYSAAWWKLTFTDEEIEAKEYRIKIILAEKSKGTTLKA